VDPGSGEPVPGGSGGRPPGPPRILSARHPESMHRFSLGRTRRADARTTLLWCRRRSESGRGGEQMGVRSSSSARDGSGRQPRVRVTLAPAGYRLARSRRASGLDRRDDRRPQFMRIRPNRPGCLPQVGRWLSIEAVADVAQAGADSRQKSVLQLFCMCSRVPMSSTTATDPIEES
jgi:hypothetical protein